MPDFPEGAEDSIHGMGWDGMEWDTRGCWDWIDLDVIGTGLTLLGWVSCSGGAISRSLGTRMAGGWWGRCPGSRPRGVTRRRRRRAHRHPGGRSACGLRRRGPGPYASTTTAARLADNSSRSPWFQLASVLPFTSVSGEPRGPRTAQRH